MRRMLWGLYTVIIIPRSILWLGHLLLVFQHFFYFMHHNSKPSSLSWFSSIPTAAHSNFLLLQLQTILSICNFFCNIFAPVFISEYNLFLISVMHLSNFSSLFTIFIRTSNPNERLGFDADKS